MTTPTPAQPVSRDEYMAQLRVEVKQFRNLGSSLCDALEFVCDIHRLMREVIATDKLLANEAALVLDVYGFAGIPAPAELRASHDRLLAACDSACPMLVLAAYEARKVNDFEAAQRHSDAAEAIRAAIAQDGGAL